jgi:NTE family protein
MLDFTQKKRCMQAGIEATQQVMPQIRAALAAWERGDMTPR